MMKNMIEECKEAYIITLIRGEGRCIVRISKRQGICDNKNEMRVTMRAGNQRDEG